MAGPAHRLRVYTLLLRQLPEIPALAPVCSDDPRPGHTRIGPLRPRPGTARPVLCSLWPGAALLLFAAHSAHPWLDGCGGLPSLWLVTLCGQSSLDLG